MPEPYTRNITVTFQESIYPLIKEAANRTRDGNVNEYIRMLVHQDLKNKGLLTAEIAVEVML